jgi:hypothetical protein
MPQVAERLPSKCKIISPNPTKIRERSLSQEPWLTPVIHAWETEIRRIVVRGQPRQIVFESPSPK